MDVSIELASEDIILYLDGGLPGTVTEDGVQTLSNKELIGPKINAALLDANGNEAIKLPATASAVNEITITNAGTGSGPTLSATGDDADIDLNLSGQGAGVVKAGGAEVEVKTGKDASGGYAGLTLRKLNLKNAAGTITSWFTTAATIARTWTLPDKDGTVAMTSDITGTNSGINTGDETTASIKAKLSITTLSGDNTGDQTNISGNAGTVTNGLYTTNKDASGGVPGLTLFKVNMRNVANTFTSWLTNTNTAARTYTFQDRDGTVADLGANTFTGDQTLGNNNLKTIKTATFNSQVNNATTTGAVTIDWTAGQNQKQAEPTGSITYTFTAPAGPCHLQLLIDSDGTSTAQTIVWPGTVIWLGSTWTGTNNKKAVINFWYDGTSYYAAGANQV